MLVIEVTNRARHVAPHHEALVHLPWVIPSFTCMDCLLAHGRVRVVTRTLCAIIMLTLCHLGLEVLSRLCHSLCTMQMDIIIQYIQWVNEEAPLQNGTLQKYEKLID